MAGACGRSNRSQSKAMIFALEVSIDWNLLYRREKYILLITTKSRQMNFFHLTTRLNS